jgi:hypothetical protein
VTCAALIGGLAMFLTSLVAHVIVWRAGRPETYRTWLPTLAMIFGLLPAITIWLTAPGALAAAGMVLLHGSLAAVYVVGYTLVSAFSPSIELLKLLDRTPGGIPASALALPLTPGSLTEERLDNLEAADLVRRDGDRLELGRRGARLTGIVLLYRHAVGLPDGQGG